MKATKAEPPAPFVISENERESPASEPSKKGRYLALTFSGDPAELARIDFCFDHKSPNSFFERAHQNSAHALNWPKVLPAISLCFLGYVVWAKSEKPGTFLFGARQTEAVFAKRLSNAINQTSHKLHQLFVGENPETKDGEADVTNLVFPSLPGINKSGRSKPTPGKPPKPVKIAVSTKFLPADCVRIFWDKEGSGDPKQLTSCSDIVELLNGIRQLHGMPMESQRTTLDNVPVGNPAGDEDAYALAIQNRYGQVPLEVLAMEGSHANISLLRLYVPQAVREWDACLSAAPETTGIERRAFATSSREWEASCLRMYEKLKSLPATFGTRDKGEPAQHQSSASEPENVVALADDNNTRRLVLLGQLGAGKSSLVQFLALRWAAARPARRELFPIPLVLEMQHYARARRDQGNITDFVDYLTAGAGAFWRHPKTQLKERLLAGHAIAYFDALDEIADVALYAEVVTSILRFATEYPLVRIIVTSRLAGYGGHALRRAGFSHFVLKEFDSKQINSFIDNWYAQTHGHVGRAEAERAANALKWAVGNSDALYELACSPLLLTMLTLLNSPQSPPVTSVELLSRCSELLLSRWKVERAVRADPDLAHEATALGLREKRSILRSVARQIAGVPGRRQRRTSSPPKANVNQNPSPSDNSIDEVTLESSIAQSIAGLRHSLPQVVARAMIEQLRERNGILGLVAPQQYGFVHHAFLEFFIADDLAEELRSGRISKKALCWKFGYLWASSRHDDALRFLCALVPPNMVEMCLNNLWREHSAPTYYQVVFFAAECLLELQRKGATTSVSAWARRELCRISNPKAPRLSDYPKPVSQEDAKKFALHPGILLWAADNYLVTSRAARALCFLVGLFPGVPQVAAHLRRVAECGEIVLLLPSVVDAVACVWEQGPELRKWLEHQASQSNSSEIRAIAQSRLYSLFGKDVDIHSTETL